MLRRWLRRAPTPPEVVLAYDRLVAQARRPEFYSGCEVPDTPSGRFEMVVLHAFLLIHRLNRDGERTKAFSQALFDRMFADMDESLRELGVGDFGIARKVKRMAEGFYGRSVAYERSLAAGDRERLAAALRRNLYGTAEPNVAAVGRMADYVRREARRLEGVPTDRLLAGEPDFGAPPAVP